MASGCSLMNCSTVVLGHHDGGDLDGLGLPARAGGYRLLAGCSTML